MSELVIEIRVAQFARHLPSFVSELVIEIRVAQLFVTSWRVASFVPMAD